MGLCDQSPAQLDAALASLADRPGAAKLRPACLDLAHGIRVTLDEESPKAAGETDAPPAALGPPL